MAGLKKSNKKDGSNPNMVLLIALIMFVLTSIGLGVFAYYGYEGQEKLRAETKAAKLAQEDFKAQRNAYALLGFEGMLAEGYLLGPDDKTLFVSYKNDLIQTPDKFAAVKPVLDAMFAEHANNLKSFNAGETKYESNYKTEIKNALEEAKKSKAMLDALQKEYNDFKTNYDGVLAKLEKENKEMRDLIQKGNQDALAAALKTNTKFPEIQKLLSQREEDIKKLNDDHTAELVERDGRIARLNLEIGDLTKKMNDRSLGLTVAGQGGGGDVHALMLDISRGLPLWDRPLGKVLRVDPTNLLVYIDIGSKAGLKPDVSFNVFATGPGGRADRQLKGTIEVVRVMNETTSAARITSLFDEKGESIPLQSESMRARAVRAADNLLREGDLLFNMFFDTHVFIAGNVNFSGYYSDSPAAQNLQLQEFMNQLRKQNIVVDGYINLLNGQVEGTITPKTRLLIRGEMTQVTRTEEEVARNKQMIETYQALKRQAIDQGMFIISAENLAAVIGYRPPQAQNNRDLNSTFRPQLPWTGGPQIRRFDRAVEGAAAPAAPAPMPEMKKDAEK